MKIGVWVDEEMNKNSGGSFTYINTLITGIDDYHFGPEIEIVFISKQSLANFKKSYINIAGHQQGISYFSKLFRKALKLLSVKVFSHLIDLIDQTEKRKKDATAAKYLKQQGVKLIFYPLPYAYVIDGIPFIVNNWDLAHYTTHAFPEIVDDKGFEKRNEWYIKVVVNALMIFSESETGKNELSKFLNIAPQKIKVLPIFSSPAFTKMIVSADNQAATLKKFNIQPQRFFFYPAQFWAHKNHFTLISAFKKFHAHNPGYKLLLCGSDKGNLQYIKNYVEQQGLTPMVVFAGFIEDNELYTLYKNTAALVMPTFLGPSNIPPLEALHLGCPIICSNLEGHKEILGDAALYFDPLDELSIFECMGLIINDEQKGKLLQAQTELFKTTDHTINKALLKLEQHFIDAIKIRNCWE